MFTNRYIYTYAAIMVIVVAAILSSAAMLLKPMQLANVRAEKIQGILASVEVETTRNTAENVYQDYIVEELAINMDGEIVSRFKDNTLEMGDVRPFEINLKEQLDLKKRLEAGRGTKNPVWPLYIMERESKRYFVVPVRGMGLWGPIWGNLAFESDFNTVAGATFDHKAETPGLGAEINTSWFQDYFKGKTIFDETGEFVSIKVVKGGVANSNVPLSHGVDAISGGTITSDGLTAMIESNLQNYVPFIKKNIK
jgi:Na+-transporting NADH:ubiquinone oxidoreductase subunit C